MKISITTYGMEMTYNTDVNVNHLDSDTIDNTKATDAVMAFMYLLSACGYHENSIKKAFLEVSDMMKNGEV